MSDIKQTKINGLSIFGPKKKGAKMLYVLEENYSVTLRDNYVVVRFSDDDAFSIADMDGDGFFEQIENTTKDSSGNLLEQIDRNRDGKVDVMYRNGEKVVPHTEMHSNKSHNGDALKRAR